MAIKNEVVELFRIGEQAGLRCTWWTFPPLRSAMPTVSLWRCGGLRHAAGHRCATALLFFEAGRVYSRSINIGANSITQDFSNR